MLTVKEFLKAKKDYAIDVENWENMKPVPPISPEWSRSKLGDDLATINVGIDEIGNCVFELSNDEDIMVLNAVLDNKDATDLGNWLIKLFKQTRRKK